MEKGGPNRPTGLEVRREGLFCPDGNFYIDPWLPVDRAIISHAHSDHARAGSRGYLCAASCEPLLRLRVGSVARIETLQFGEPMQIGRARVSLHPAGHILGSAQVRVEGPEGVVVYSGDYKLENSPVAEPFEPVKCNDFISECTFGLPIYRWQPQETVFATINQWWRKNQAAGRVSVLFAYSLGKAQRLLNGIDPTIGPIAAHASVAAFHSAYRSTGVHLPEILTGTGSAGPLRQPGCTGMLIAPPSTDGSTWLGRFGDVSKAFVSGWMAVRGVRRRRSVDQGFVISDHADWVGLISAVRATGAERIGLTHGQTEPMERYLREECSLDAYSIPSRTSPELSRE